MAAYSSSINTSNLTTPGGQFISDKVTKLINEKKSAREFQVRKHTDWNENYELYRNKVKTNRLTQRQAANIPLMKETIKTILSKIDDAPEVSWKEKSGDEMKEIIYQEMWDSMFKRENLNLKDIQDKKNVLLYGISTKKLNLYEKGICTDILDVFDVVYDPLTNPLDVETARYIVHQNIFKPLRDILVDDRYTREGKAQLKRWLATDKGIVQSSKNKEAWERSVERLRSMGVQNEKFSLFAGGDVLVNLNEHFTQLWNNKLKKFERHVVVIADDSIELSDELLVDCIGIEEWPFEFWSEDSETNDIYPDSVADLVRTPNKVINVWFSQQVESRTLSNFGMHWYDATIQGYTPQTYEPGPGRMLPAPGDPNKTIMPVAINGLDDTLNAINFVTNIVERGTGATAIEKGQTEQGIQTLGEIQILAGKAQERAKTSSKYYKDSWYRLAVKWDKMMQANKFDKMTLYKTGIGGKMYEKVVYNADWKSKAGYDPTVASSSEQEADDLKSIQKFGYVAAQSPENQVLKSILQQRSLKILDLTPAELKDVKEEQDRLSQVAMQPPPMNPTQPTDAAPQQAAQSSQDPAMTASIQDSLQQIGQLMGS
jgi:hypothetical protein